MNSYTQILWRRSVAVIIAAQLHSSMPELRFSSGSNLIHGVLEICDGENFWRWPRSVVIDRSYCCFFSMKFAPYGILRYSRNTWVFSWIFHNIGKCIKICSIKLPSYGKLHHLDGTWIFPWSPVARLKSTKPTITWEEHGILIPILFSK